MKSKILILLISIIISSCDISYKVDNNKDTAPISEHALAMATIYTYYADEYRALTYQAYNIAGERVDDILKNHPGNDMLAIVVDIDETLMDNSPFEALMIERDSNYPFMWNEWCDLARAKAVPGAVKFLQYADANGLNIFYVSNRKKEYVQESTMKNLRSLGFPQVDEQHFMLRLARSDDNPNPSDKQMRRDEISARGYDIVSLIGDNLGDFYTDESEVAARNLQLESFKEEFGNKFIVLPNAMYGNWSMSLGITNAETMDSLLRVMNEVFN